MKIEKVADEFRVSLVSLDWGTKILENAELSEKELYGEFEFWGDTAILKGNFIQGNFSGKLQIDNAIFPLSATKQSYEPVDINRSHLTYILSEAELPESEKNIDHAGILGGSDREGFKRGERIYSSNCINCHGNPEVEGSIPSATKFWEAPFKAGSDAYSMYQTLTKGFGTMPPQPVLTPQEKYDVISYIQHTFVRQNPQEDLIPNSPGYLAQLPKGNSRGPEVKPYQPWADMDYGDFLINTYELVDEQTGPERYHSPRPVPYADENYLDNNFAYKGIA
ncbi:MAG: cytochrome c, partial [Eudoraea sp.]|nr:cytochrome c [Eudoraea sp.]